MPINFILFIAALLVSFLLFRWLFTVIKSTVINLLMIALIIVLLQFAFGISYQELFNEIIKLPQTFQDFFDSTVSLFDNILSI
ncbi:MAG: hypothetical protein QNJ33_14610 [Crocosphaera sp.]|nr:hypothetical protein [Crocosphaera sp.]